MPSNHVETFRSFNRSLFVLVGIFALDQWTKELFAAQAILNTGVSFSFFHAVPNTLLVGLLFALILGLWWVLRPYMHRGRVAWLGHTLFFGGALSNLFDRARYGGVRDIWLIPGTSIQNNVADWFIAIGVFALIISTLLLSSSKKGRAEQGSGLHES